MVFPLKFIEKVCKNKEKEARSLKVLEGNEIVDSILYAKKESPKDFDVHSSAWGQER